ncbi:hypothetical protein GWR56_07995 [Mucilaginibacter sp. 14171R-50]|uniref:hypothetical protein n=1 Tax=Mucilaginibacter sp. 14171R-50 TaxID=2703789 RepID=UPI00138DC353|nr:hypothetical protein [Mucilaginibacter sp. 14171R-50]QHS55482.1 hypothetical protein GWR56_07995 [Mucilaginibacter sp. 14171R-50]
MQANWTYIVLTLCVLQAAVFAWQEYRRVNKRNLTLRMLAVIAAVAALACIALPIGYTGNVAKMAKHKTILLTDGFNDDSLSAVDSNIVTTEVNVKQAYPRAKLINSTDELSRNNQLHIYGYGLSRAGLLELDSLPFIFHPASLPGGVSHISWSNHLKAGDAMQVQGVYNNPSSKKVKLVLKGLNTGLDSVTLAPKAQTTFNLSTVPKTTGKIVFTLHADTSLQGYIPVEITSTEPLKVLMLSASPDFETRFLKNWLTQNGYAVALRAAISKNKYNSEYINIDKLSLERLSTQTLGKFDVVMGDLSVFSSLSPGETDALKQQVADKGLGLIVRSDSAGKASWLQKQFAVDKPSGKEPAPAQLIIDGKKSAVKLSYGPSHIIYQDGTLPLVKTTQGGVLSSSALFGSGKIIFTTLNNTFSWMLAGSKRDYTALWSALLSKAARKDNVVKNNVEFSGLPFVNHPVLLHVARGKASPITVNGQTVASVQNADIPFEYNAMYWPPSAGWQNMEENGRLSAWYAYAENNWKAVQAADKISATKKYAGEHKITDIVTKQIHQKVRIEVPKIYFYILLLAACTFLWVEAKLS